MFKLNRLILIDSYKPGTLQEVRLDGHTNLNGVNGAGKTTLLRLIPLFFGERPGRLVPKNRVTDSFAKHYLPNESSYIIFEYLRNEQVCQVVIYASPNEEGLCYRFVDKGFDSDDFMEQRADGLLMPISCRDLGRHLSKKQINCSNQLTARDDYRTVIQNLPHKKGQEIRNLIARYSFCEGSTGRRLKDIEKIVSGMLMRSTDFADLREMLVNCIDENSEAIALEVQMETLDSWHKEYRAFQETEAERAQAVELSRLDNDLRQIELGLTELQQRLQLLLNSHQQHKQQQEEAGTLLSQQVMSVKLQWDEQEQTIKSELASVNAELQTAEKQKTALEQERASWEQQSIQQKRLLYSRLHQIKSDLALEEGNRRTLMAHVQDIEAEFGRMKAEKEKHVADQQHKLELTSQNIRQQASEQISQASQATEAQKETLHEHAQQQQETTNQSLGDLRQQLGVLNGKMAEIQPDPVLLENRELKLSAQQDLQQKKQEAEDAIKKIDTENRSNQQQIDGVLKDQQKLADDKQQLESAILQKQQQLAADSATVLGFLREQQPEWGQTIAKVLNPDLLLRDDLEPSWQANHADSCYGLVLNLDVLPADQTADESQIRLDLQALEHQLKQLQLAERESAEQLDNLHKNADKIKKQRKTADLALGQIQTQLKKLSDELLSLKQQIERSKKQRTAELEQEKQAVNLLISQTDAQLQLLKQQLNQELQALQQRLLTKTKQINVQAEQEIQQTLQQIAVLNQQKGQELAQLEQQRLSCLRERKIDTATLTALESKIAQLKADETAAEQAGGMVQDYQRWLDKDWSRYQDWLDQSNNARQQQQRLDAALSQANNLYLQQRKSLEAQLEQIKSALSKLDKDIATICRLLEDLKNYPKRIIELVSFDSAHDLLLLQTDYRKLTEQHKTQRKELAQLISHFKRVLSRFPGSDPAKYYASVENECGIDGDDTVWLTPILNWYDSRYLESKRLLVVQAQNFGSAIRNYQQNLAKFDRGIDSLSRRLAANIDSNIRFEKIESIQGRLTSKVATLGYWEQLVVFTKNFDDWNRTGDGALPGREFADMVKQVSEQLQGKGRVEMKLVNLLELEIIVTENGRNKRATHAEELRQISSHGLSYLILCVFFIALVNMIRKDQPLNIIWPMDELKELHQMNIELLIDILTKNHITLLSAFPDPDPDVLRLFKNRYQVIGNRELVEMEFDADYLASLEPLAEIGHV
jgi:hypothetical protein